MQTDNSIASFWHAYEAAGKAVKRSTDETEPPSLYLMADAVNADQSPDNAMLEVAGYRQ